MPTNEPYYLCDGTAVSTDAKICFYNFNYYSTQDEKIYHQVYTLDNIRMNENNPEFSKAILPVQFYYADKTPVPNDKQIIFDSETNHFYVNNIRVKMIEDFDEELENEFEESHFSKPATPRSRPQTTLFSPQDTTTPPQTPLTSVMTPGALDAGPNTIRSYFDEMLTLLSMKRISKKRSLSQANNSENNPENEDKNSSPDKKSPQK